MTLQPGTPADTAPSPSRRADRTHLLYLAVIAAVLAGVVLGFVAPDVAQSLRPLGTGFVSLVKMMISPIIFTTIVLGVGSVRSAAQVGKVGGLALGYFLTMSTAALAIGLVVGNLLHPGQGLQLDETTRAAGRGAAGESGGTVDFLLGIIPTSLFSSVTSGEVLQTLFVALLVGFALQSLGERGTPVLTAVTSLQRVVFKVLAMIMWVAPVGAFGAIAAVVGSAGLDAIRSLAVVMLGFYATCLLFVLLVLGTVLRAVTGLSVLRLLRYLAREFLLIVSTSSSETALPRLIAKMEHVGVSRPVVGITVPTGYSFNLDGTAIYLTMASLFIAQATGNPLSVGEQVSLLVFMVIASKGAAGVTGAGLATLAGGLSTHRPELLDGVGLIVGIDRFMSEARALTNFAGNAVATVLVGRWTGQLDLDRARRVLAGEQPFDESSFTDDHGTGSPAPGREAYADLQDARPQEDRVPRVVTPQAGTAQG